MKRLLALLILVLLPLIPLGPTIAAGDVIGPTNQIATMSPWMTPAPDQPWDVLQADGVLQFLPWRDLVLSSWAEGRAPTWNPYQLAGAPLAANGQSAAFYPPHMILGFLHVPTGAAMILLAWFHLAVAAWGTYAFARRLGADETGGLVAGITFGLSPFLLAWTALPSVPSTVAWIPVILAILTRIALDPESRPVRNVAALAAAGAMMALAGHLQFIAYGAMAAILWTLCLIPMAIRYRRVPILAATVGIAAITGGVLVAPQLKAVLDNSQFSHRRNIPTEEGYQAYVASAIQPYELANLPAAGVLGDPRSYVAVGDAKGPGYWVPFVKIGGNLAESAVTVGAFTLALLAFAPWRRPSTICLSGLAILSLLLAMGTPVNRMLYFGLPGWSSSGSPGRIIVLFVLMASVLAGLGATHLVGRGFKRSIPFALLGVLPLALWSLALPRNPEFLAEHGLDPATFAAWSQTAAQNGFLATIFGVVLAAIAIYVATQRARPQTLPIAAVLAAIPASLALTLVTHGAPLKSPATIPPDRRIAIINDGWAITQAAPAILPPNLPSLFRMMDLGGYDSLLHRDTVAMLHEVGDADPAPPANGNMMFIKPSADPARLADAGVTDVWSRKPIYGRSSGPFELGDYYRTPIEGPGIITSPRSDARLSRLDTSGFIVRATGPGPAAIRFRNLPGWAITVNGQTAAPGSGRWIELNLPDGDCVIAGVFQPGLHIQTLLSAMTLLLALFAIPRRSRPMTPTQGKPTNSNEPANP